MKLGTYGLGTAINGPGRFGAGLGGQGNEQQATATRLLGQAADEETSRNIANQQQEAQEKAGKAQLGSSIGAGAGMAIGAQYGASAGPWGALIGGIVGAFGSQLF